MSVWFRARSLIATIVFAGAASPALSPAQADDGRIQFTVLKAGLVIGGSGGSGRLSFKGRRYALSIGGLSYGFTFGASRTNFRGSVSNIRRPQDVEGVYVAGSAGAALGRGAQVIVLTNPKRSRAQPFRPICRRDRLCRSQRPRALARPLAIFICSGTQRQELTSAHCHKAEPA
jgi:hypothetical protein